MRFVDETVKRLLALERANSRQRSAEAMWECLPFQGYTTTTLQPYSTSNIFPYVACQPGIALTLAKFVVNTFVATTNDGSNFWTVTLTSGTTATIVSVTTAIDSVGTWTVHEVTSGFSNPYAASNKMFFIKLTKTGTPGTLSLNHQLLVRNGS